jgi:hypothetical protein
MTNDDTEACILSVQTCRNPACHTTREQGSSLIACRLFISSSNDCTLKTPLEHQHLISPISHPSSLSFRHYTEPPIIPGPLCLLLNLLLALCFPPSPPRTTSSPSAKLGAKIGLSIPLSAVLALSPIPSNKLNLCVDPFRSRTRRVRCMP